MQCLKCGRQTEGTQVFCGDCLAGMESYPVKPGTAVILPNRGNAKKRSASSKQNKPEDVIHHLQRKVRRLTRLVCVLGVLLILTASALGYLLTHSDTGPSIGQNYSTVTNPQESQTAR